MNRIFIVATTESKCSNTNGNPDGDGDPRELPDNKGIISDVSQKRKWRNLAMLKNGPVWRQAASLAGINDDDQYRILEENGRGLPDPSPDNDSNLQRVLEMPVQEVVRHYVDVRLFGGFLKQKKDDKQGKKTLGFALGGAVCVSTSVSLAPIEILRLTNTSMAAKQSGKGSGLAPEGFRVVKHGVYVGTISIAATQMIRASCTDRDVALFLGILPYIYQENPSRIRPDVCFRNLWVVEHRGPLGGCPEHLIRDALTPKTTCEKPTGPEHYVYPDGLPDSLMDRVSSCVDIAGGIPDAATLQSIFKKSPLCL